MQADSHHVLNELLPCLEVMILLVQEDRWEFLDCLF